MSNWGLPFSVTPPLKYDYKAMLDEMAEEMILKVIAKQDAKFCTWEFLIDQGFPIPPDLEREIEMATTPDGWV